MIVNKQVIQPLNVFAGKEAFAHIQKQGLEPDDIAMLLGASSGPKWLTLHGLDRYLIEHTVSHRSKPLHLLGTSAGAWRMACFAQQAPMAAHERLTEAYVEQRYSPKPSGREVLTTCRSIVQTLLGECGASDIINNPLVRMNLITTQCHGLSRARNRALKSLGFGMAAALNVAARKSLGWQFTRVLMHHPESNLRSQDFLDLPTRHSALRTDNIENAILSTGAIPLIIDGVEDVAGSGIYQDGGITDYGFDLPLLPEEGFVLYPHFAKQPAPGWFDKQLSWRKPSHDNYSRTIMLVPSEEFVARLPNGRIPDRHDFLNFSDAQRIRDWREVIKLTEALAEDLSTIDWPSRVQPLPW